MVVHAAALQILHDHSEFTFEKGLGYPRRLNANGMKINSAQTRPYGGSHSWG
jgi:hypothetical protein